MPETDDDINEEFDLSRAYGHVYRDAAVARFKELAEFAIANATHLELNMVAMNIAVFAAHGTKLSEKFFIERDAEYQRMRRRELAVVSRGSASRRRRRTPANPNLRLCDPIG